MSKKIELNRFQRITKCDGKTLRLMIDGTVYTLEIDNAADLAHQLDKHLLWENHALESNS